MKKINIGKSLTILVLALVLAVTVTYAWIAYSETIDGGPISVGKLDYTYSGDFIDGSIDPIYPHKELLQSSISVNNQSSISSQLRVRIEYTLVETSSTNKIYRAEATDDLSVTFISNFSYDNDYWYYESINYKILTASGPIGIISSLYYDGFKSSNEYSSEVINISVLVQVKQGDNVDWADLTTYNFTTGNPI